MGNWIRFKLLLVFKFYDFMDKKESGFTSIYTPSTLEVNAFIMPFFKKEKESPIQVIEALWIG